MCSHRFAGEPELIVVLVSVCLTNDGSARMHHRHGRVLSESQSGSCLKCVMARMMTLPSLKQTQLRSMILPWTQSNGSMSE